MRRAAMKYQWILTVIVCVFVVALSDRSIAAQTAKPETEPSYLGFDRNDYPGDENLPVLRQAFSFTGYWLNAPPGASRNSWTGKREAIRKAGFGFLVLFNGRLDAELKKAKSAAEMGRSDADLAVAAAKREGFPEHTVIFLDVEEGGRMLPEQKAYIYGWIDAVNMGGFRAGVYCSGIAAKEGGGIEVTTATDLHENAGQRSIVLWVANDACPPSPGCVFPKRSPAPSESGIAFADVWQLAQSPRRPNLTKACRATYDRDGNCYAPGTREKGLFLDVDTATKADPSDGR
jgi:hypothetical protein